MQAANENEQHRLSGSDSEHDEISRVARELWRSRKPGETGSAEDDWYRAVQIVSTRRKQSGKNAAGNSPSQAESYVGGARSLRPNQFLTRKGSENMQNTSTGYTGSTESTGSSGTMGSLKESVTEQYSDVSNRVGQMLDREPKSMPRGEHREGPLARAIEQQTAKLPSDTWLWAAVGSIGLSLALELSGREKTASFVGHWAPTFLILGLYNKMVKLQGSDGI